MPSSFNVSLTGTCSVQHRWSLGAVKSEIQNKTSENCMELLASERGLTLLIKLC